MVRFSCSRRSHHGEEESDQEETIQSGAITEGCSEGSAGREETASPTKDTQSKDGLSREEGYKVDRHVPTALLSGRGNWLPCPASFFPGIGSLADNSFAILQILPHERF